MAQLRLPGYRLHPTSSGTGPARWVGTRELDNARVVLVVDPDGRAADHEDRLGWQIDGLVPVVDVVDLESGIGVIYLDPPRHTVQEALDEMGACAPDEALGVLLRVVEVAGQMSARGLPARAVPLELLGVAGDGSIWICENLPAPGSSSPADLGDPLASAPGDWLTAVLTLAAQFLPAAGDAAAGLDGADEEWAAFRAFVETMNQAVQGGASLTLEDFAAGLRGLGASAPLPLPAGWNRPAPDEIVSRMRALAVEFDDLESHRSGRRGEGARGRKRDWPARRDFRGRFAAIGRTPNGSGSRGRPAAGRAGGARPRGAARALGARRGNVVPARAAGDWRARAAGWWNWVAARPVRYLPVMGSALLLSALVFILVGKGASGPAQAQAGSPTALPPTAQLTSAGPTSAQRPGTEAGATAVPAPTPANPSASTSGGGDPALADPLADLTGPLTYPEVVAQALADLRAEAWTTLDLGVVRELNAPGSPALAADSRAVARAADDGLHYAGLDFRVRDASARPAVSSGASSAAERVTLTATVDASGFTITRPDGRTTTATSRPGTTVRLELLWSGERWQVAEAT